MLLGKSTIGPGNGAKSVGTLKIVKRLPDDPREYPRRVKGDKSTQSGQPFDVVVERWGLDAQLVGDESECQGVEPIPIRNAHACRNDIIHIDSHLAAHLGAR